MGGWDGMGGKRRLFYVALAGIRDGDDLLAPKTRSWRSRGCGCRCNCDCEVDRRLDAPQCHRAACCPLGQLSRRRWSLVRCPYKLKMPGYIAHAEFWERIRGRGECDQGRLLSQLIGLQRRSAKKWGHCRQRTKERQGGVAGVHTR